VDSDSNDALNTYQEVSKYLKSFQGRLPLGHEVEFTDEDFTLALEALEHTATPGPSRYLKSPDMTFAVTPAKIFS